MFFASVTYVKNTPLLISFFVSRDVCETLVDDLKFTIDFFKKM